MLVQGGAERGLLNAVLAYGVTIELSLPDTSTCTHSWKKLGAKCQSGVNLRIILFQVFSFAALLLYMKDLVS